MEGQNVSDSIQMKNKEAYCLNTIAEPISLTDSYTIDYYFLLLSVYVNQ